MPTSQIALHTPGAYQPRSYQHRPAPLPRHHVRIQGTKTKQAPAPPQLRTEAFFLPLFTEHLMHRPTASKEAMFLFKSLLLRRFIFMLVS